MAKPVVLVVEDDDQTALLIRHSLESEGYDVRHAADGRQALIMVAGMAPPALVTLDLELPHATGDDLMMQIRTTAGWENVPVIMLTATPKGPDTPWAVRAGSQAYLVKPFKPSQLIKTIGKLVSKSG